MRPREPTLLDEDADLVRRIGASPGGCLDDESALYRRFAPRVMRYGLRHLRDRARAEDLAHDVMLVVLEAIRAGRVREPAKLASFVLGTARNLARADRRSETLHHALLDGMPEPEPIAPPPIAPARIAGCLDGLSERERTVLLLTFYEERSADAIAAAVGASAENVRVLRHRALLQLRACVEGRG